VNDQRVTAFRKVLTSLIESLEATVRVAHRRVLWYEPFHTLPVRLILVRDTLGTSGSGLVCSVARAQAGTAAAAAGFFCPPHDR